MKLTKERAKELVAENIWQTVLTSCKIEGIKTDDLKRPKMEISDQLLKNLGYTLKEDW